MEEIFEVLKKYWGFETFRPPQEEIVRAVLQKRDVLALLPTGGGKSVCFQLPAMLLEGKTLVISPLIALMEDQILTLREKRIKAGYIHSGLHFKQVERTMDQFAFGDLKLLYVAPERLTSVYFQERIRHIKLSLIAVDEAHCISQWGYDFRPAYLEIAHIRKLKPKVPVIALTATATEKVAEDIRTLLELQKPAVFKKSFSRENISFVVCNTEDKKGELAHIIHKIKGSGIIYVRNRKQTTEISQWLINKGVSAVGYHGGMDKVQRDQFQMAWIKSQVRWIVCTNAFGMGIDKPDVRAVIHLDIPASLEEYYQEAGRAGRDGKESVAVVIFDEQDTMKAMQDFQDAYPAVDTISETYDLLCRYCSVAYGAGLDETYDFSTTSFATFLKQPVKNVYQKLQILEKEGWVSFNDGFHEPTKIMIICSPRDLFFTDYLKEEKSKVLTYLLRKFEGLFLDFVKIDEIRIAKDLDISEHKLMAMLQLLKTEGILDVQFKKSVPQVTFLRSRPEKKYFSFDEKRYLARKKMAKDRLGKMIAYLETSDDCRQKFILDYFDEKTDKCCNKCDYCRYKAEGLPQQEFVDHVLNVLQEIIQSEKQIDIKAFIKRWPYNKRQKVKTSLNLLEEHGQIAISRTGVLKCE